MNKKVGKYKGGKVRNRESVRIESESKFITQNNQITYQNGRLFAIRNCFK